MISAGISTLYYFILFSKYHKIMFYCHDVMLTLVMFVSTLFAWNMYTNQAI